MILYGGRLIIVAHSSFQCRARAKGGTPTRSDHHRFPCLWVAPFPGRTLDNPKRTESADRNFVAIRQRLLYCDEDRIYDICDLAFRLG